MAVVNEFIKAAAVEGIKKGGEALVTAVCKELSTDQLQGMIDIVKKELERRATSAKAV